MAVQFCHIKKASKKANKAWLEFSKSHQKEYTQWIDEAKNNATKNKRLTTAIEWMEEGKDRNWKYKKRDLDL